MPAEDIGLELSAEHFPWKVFHCTRLAEGAVVEKSIQFSTRFFHHFIEGTPDRLGIFQIQFKTIDAFRLEFLYIFLFPAGSNDLVSSLMQLMGAVISDSAGTAGDQNAFGFGFLIRHNQTRSEELRGLRMGLMVFISSFRLEQERSEKRTGSMDAWKLSSSRCIWMDTKIASSRHS